MRARSGVNLGDLAIMLGFPEAALLTSAGVGRIELVCTEDLPEGRHLSVRRMVLLAGFLAFWCLSFPVDLFHSLPLLVEHDVDTIDCSCSSSEKTLGVLHMPGDGLTKEEGIEADFLGSQIELPAELSYNIFNSLAFVVISPLFAVKIEVVGDLRPFGGVNSRGWIFRNLSIPADAEEGEGQELRERNFFHFNPCSCFD